MKQRLHIQLKQNSSSSLAPFLFLLLFFCSMGYQFGTGNQLVFLPVIESMHLFTHLQKDFGVISHIDYNPFFNYAFALGSKLMALPMLFFIAQSALIIALFIILKKMHALFFSNTRTFWFSLILLLAWQPQSPDGNVFWTNRLEGQYCGWLLLSFSFYYFLKGSSFRAGLWTGAAYLIHLQLGLLSTAALTCAGFLLPKGTRSVYLSKFLAGAAVLGLPVFIYFSNSIFHEKALTGALFLDYARLRMPHHMLWNARLYFFFLGLLFIPTVMYRIPQCQALFKPSATAPVKRLQWLYLCIFFLGSLQYLDYYCLNIGYFARLQFLRLLPFLYISGIFFIAHAFQTWALSQSFWQRTLVILSIFILGPRLIAYESLSKNLVFIVAASGMFIFWCLLKRKKSQLLLIISSLFFTTLTQHILWQPGQLPSWRTTPWAFDTSQKKGDDWITICSLTERLTPLKALILNPPYMKGFVYYSKRAGFVEFKSGANHESTFHEWKTRLELSMGGNELASCSGESCLNSLRTFYNTLTPLAIEKIQNQYHATFFITESSQNYPYPLVATQGPFKLYLIEPLPSLVQASPRL